MDIMQVPFCESFATGRKGRKISRKKKTFLKKTENEICKNSAMRKSTKNEKYIYNDSYLCYSPAKITILHL